MLNLFALWFSLVVSLAEGEIQLLEKLNLERAQGNLPTLSHNPALSDVARHYSDQLVSENRFSHTDQAGKGMIDRVNAARIGHRRLSETVALAYDVPSIHQALMDSPEHKKILLDPKVSEVGIGLRQVTEQDQYTAGGYTQASLKDWLVVTQLFRKPE